MQVTGRIQKGRTKEFQGSEKGGTRIVRTGSDINSGQIAISPQRIQQCLPYKMNYQLSLFNAYRIAKVHSIS